MLLLIDVTYKWSKNNKQRTSNYVPFNRKVCKQTVGGSQSDNIVQVFAPNTQRNSSATVAAVRRMIMDSDKDNNNFMVNKIAEVEWRSRMVFNLDGVASWSAPLLWHWSSV